MSWLGDKVGGALISERRDGKATKLEAACHPLKADSVRTLSPRSHVTHNYHNNMAPGDFDRYDDNRYAVLQLHHWQPIHFS